MRKPTRRARDRHPVSWPASEEQARDETAAALFAAFADSDSFRQTRRIAELIAGLGSLTTDEWQQVDAAAEANPQIPSAVYFSHPKRPPVAEWLRMTMGGIGQHRTNTAPAPGTMMRATA